MRIGEGYWSAWRGGNGRLYLKLMGRIWKEAVERNVDEQAG